VADSLIYVAVCRQTFKNWVKVGYMKLCVDRELNCRRQLVT
jgi:hypothetical protein